MKRILTTIGFSGLLTLAATSAFAIEPCKFYAGISAGYGMMNGTGLKYDSIYQPYQPAAGGNPAVIALWSKRHSLSDKRPSGALFNLHAGYSISESLRADVSFGYRPYYKVSDAIMIDSSATPLQFTDPTTRLKQKAFNAMANLYYDFNNSSSFTPFVLVGIGMEKTKATIISNIGDQYTQDIVDDANQGSIIAADAKFTDRINSKSKSNFAFNVGMGVAYKVSQKVYIDLTYKIGNASKNKFGNIGTKSSSTPAMTGVYRDVKHSKLGAYQHSINLGVRFVF